MQQQATYEEVEIVPSERKEEGWKAYLSRREEFLRDRRPTAEELKGLHRVLTSHYDFGPIIEPNRDVWMLDLISVDREDGEEVHDRFNERLPALSEKSREEGIPMPSYFERVRELHAEVCKDGTEVELNPQISGELRSYGRRKIGDGEWKVVYASHTCNFTNPIEALMLAQGDSLDFQPKAYYGLSTGLDEVYEAMCAKYDQLMQENAGAGLDRKLLVESFLQMIGTRVLHPFWDANGRAFGAHLALMLEREGIPLRDHAQTAEIAKHLTWVNDKFLEKIVYKDAKTIFVEGTKHSRIRFNHGARHDYMLRLRSAIEAAISGGIDESSSSYWYFAATAGIIKRGLIHYGLIEGAQ